MTIQRTIHTTLGAGLLGIALVARAQNPVTFQVDMTTQTGYTDVYVRGAFNNWGNAPQAPTPLTNNGSGVFTGTVDVAGAPGTAQDYKFYFDPGANWENPASTCGNNRTFTIAGGAQVLPVVYFNDTPPVLPNNNITFQCDMTAQVLAGAFVNGTDLIRVSGGFNGWGDGDLLTNNPALSGNASNIYSGVFNAQGVPGACQSYKFRAKGGWESPASTGGNNRTFQLAGGDQTLPLVYYNDASPCDLLQQDTAVTFVLNITNGTVAGDGHVFDRNVDKLHLNGEFLGWWAWYDGVAGGNNASNELTNNPVGSDNYQQTFTIPKGSSLGVTYKFSINGFDNELPAFINHSRYIRASTGTYTMPTDHYQTNGPAPAEVSFGDLIVGPPSGGNVPVSWLGRQCVTLQSRTNLTSGSWQDLPATDGKSATNYPNGGTTFFRLQKKP